jgi:tetratricopeptide (TPR) repeat protein
MIEALKSLLSRAAQARQSGESADAERLFKQAAAEAANDDAIARAEGLMGVAQARRDRGDRIGAAIYYSEAITLLRNAENAERLAYALRHAAEVRSELNEFAVAANHIQEAIRLYSGLDIADPLGLANSLRVSALNDEREAQASWREARELYSGAQIGAGVDEANRHLDRLQHKDLSSTSARKIVVGAKRGTPTDGVKHGS